MKGRETEAQTYLHGDASHLGEVEEVEAELLHPIGEELDVRDLLQTFHQGPGAVVHAHLGYYLQSKYAG